MTKDKAKIKGVFRNNVMQGKGQMIDKENNVINGIWSYGVVNEDLTNKKLGTKDLIVYRISYYTGWIVSKL